MKRRRVILGIVAALTLLILSLTAAIFHPHDNESLFRFLDQYGAAEQRSPWATKYDTGEYVRYHFKADYDTFSEAPRSRLLATGFTDITDPNKYYRLQRYERQAFEHVRVEIQFAIMRSGPAVNNSIHFWIDVQVVRTKPRFSIRDYWNYFKREYVKIRAKVEYRQAL